MKKVALLLSGNIRTFFYKDFHIAKYYSELVNSQNIDVFIYTDNNDFNYNGVQYFSENNQDKILGIPVYLDKRYHDKQEFINYECSNRIITENLSNIFKSKLKKIYVEDYNPTLIDTIYEKKNIYHNSFMNNNYANIGRKKALMCQFYKLYACYKLMVNYERENNIEYDIIIKSRFDGILNNLNNCDVRSFDLTNNIYCEGYGKFMNDWWAIGNKFIMNIYCNYYLFISSNMVDGVYCFCTNNDWEIVNTQNVEDYRKNNTVYEDASDSGEFGLTYLIRHKHNYNLWYSHNISIDLSSKFYI
jgi:hypothetical protein